LEKGGFVRRSGSIIGRQPLIADADILPPSDDHIFKTLLTHPDAGPVLRSVVSTVIERSVVSAQVRNNELPAMDVNEKAQRLDVNCVVDGGDQVNVEMQSSQVEEDTADEHRSLINKSIYYMTDLHSSQKSKGVKFQDLARTYQVMFCGYPVFPLWPDFISRISLRRSTGEQISDQINMVIIEMSKLGGILSKPIETLTLLEMWSAFFMFAPESKYRNVINNIIEIKEEIGMASALLMEISKDDHERALFLSRKKAEMERVSNLLTAEDRGRRLGRAEGLDEVLALIDKGLSRAEIKTILGR